MLTRDLWYSMAYPNRLKSVPRQSGLKRVFFMKPFFKDQLLKMYINKVLVELELLPALRTSAWDKGRV